MWLANVFDYQNYEKRDSRHVLSKPEQDTITISVKHNYPYAVEHLCLFFSLELKGYSGKTKTQFLSLSEKKGGSLTIR